MKTYRPKKADNPCGDHERQGGASENVELSSLVGQWKNILSATVQPAMILDTEYRIIAANRPVWEKLGTSEESLVGKNCYEIFHGTRKSAPGCPLNTMLKTGRLETVEMEVETVHGTFLVSCIPIFDAFHSLVGVVHLAADITEKKKAETLLRGQEEKYRYLFENSPAGMFRSSLKDGKIVDANRAFLKLFGAEKKKELMAVDFYASPGERDRLVEMIRKDKIVEGFETKMLRKDGSPFRALLSARLNEKEGLVEGVIFDITLQKEAEEALQESEERYRAAIENSNDCVAIFNDGVYVYVNQKYIETLGIDDPDSLLGTKIGKYIHPDDYGFVESYREKRKAGKAVPARYELRIVRKDGRIMYFDASVSVITLKGERVSLVFMRDITDRKEAEKKLEEQVHFLQNLIDTMPYPVFIKDSDGKYILCNKAFEEYYGVSRKLLTGKNVFDIRPTSEAEKHCEYDRSLFKTHGIVEYESVVTDPSGDVRTVMYRKAAFLKPDGTVGGIVGVVIDITELKKAEALLRESEAKYRSVAEESLVGVYIIQDNVFKYVNKRFCEIHGYSYDEIVDRMSPLDLTYDDDRPVVMENIRKRLEGEVGSMQYEFRIKRKDGRIIRVKVIGGACDYMGKPAAIGTFLDITRETILEEQLQQAQKMEAIGQLAGGVAHDFNNILTTIIGYCSILQMDLAEGDPNLLHLEQIRMASEKGAQLTNSLLAFGRKQVMELKPHKFNAIVKSIEKLLVRLLPEDVILKIVLLHEDLTVLADSTQIYQLFMNLTTNARDAMPMGGTLTIKTSAVEIDDDFITMRGFGEKGRYVLLSVSDTGSGMDGSTKEKMFEPFFTTKEPGKGTGLGLSVIYGIVKQHNGFIEVQSEPGEGTTFLVYFPVAKSKTELKTDRISAYRGGNETILIAEDSDDVRRLTGEVLRKSGYRVIEAVDGQQAISLFLENSGSIDLVILDVVMPNKNGREVYNEITMIRPRIKVLFVSGYTADVLIDKGIPDRSIEYLAKPLSPVLLLGKVREILDKK